MDSSAPGPTGVATPARHRQRVAAGREGQARAELLVGAGLVLVVAAVGVLFAFRASPVFVDRWVIHLVGPSGTGALTGVTGLRYPQVIVVGSVIAAVVAFPTDRLRSLACLVGPPLALVTCELVVKPLVGRHLGGGLSYPSGSTVGCRRAGHGGRAGRSGPVASGDRRGGRGLHAVDGASPWSPSNGTIPTDAVAGLAYGAGVVLVVDGGLWRGTTALAERRSRPTASGGG